MFSSFSFLLSEANYCNDCCKEHSGCDSDYETVVVASVAHNYNFFPWIGFMDDNMPCWSFVDNMDYFDWWFVNNMDYFDWCFVNNMDDLSWLFVNNMNDLSWSLDDYSFFLLICE